jgi:membrane associated rhomboid family serine protease
MIGTGVMISIMFVCELLQTGGIAAVSSNPMIGPDESTLLQMGAKYGPAIVDGEYYRFATGILLQNGAVTYVLSLLFLRVCCSVEQRSGYWLACMLFFLTGVYGFVLSCIFVPELVSCGTTGPLAGYFAVDIVHVLAAWRDETKPCRSLVVRIALIVLMVLVGLTPFIDNFMHLGAIIMGVLSAVMLLPNIAYSPAQGIIRSIVALVAFPLTAIVFMLSLVVFFRTTNAGQTWCTSCMKATCVRLFDWCKNL